MPATPMLTFTADLQSSAGASVLVVPSAGYQAGSWARPSRPVRRQVVQGAYNPGEVQLSEVLDTGRLALTVEVYGASYGQLQTRYDALVAAAQQGPDALVAVTIDGTARTWRVTGSANVTTLDGREGDVRRWSYREQVVLDWPVHPYPS